MNDLPHPGEQPGDPSTDPDANGLGPDGWDDAEPEERPLVLERLRHFGWLAVVLVPLLVITLAQTFMSMEWALIVFIGGLVAITAWMQRENDD